MRRGSPIVSNNLLEKSERADRRQTRWARSWRTGSPSGNRQTASGRQHPTRNRGGDESPNTPLASRLYL